MYLEIVFSLYKQLLYIGGQFVTWDYIFCVRMKRHLINDGLASGEEKQRDKYRKKGFDCFHFKRG